LYMAMFQGHVIWAF